MVGSSITALRKILTWPYVMSRPQPIMTLPPRNNLIRNPRSRDGDPHKAQYTLQKHLWPDCCSLIYLCPEWTASWGSDGVPWSRLLAIFGTVFGSLVMPSLICAKLLFMLFLWGRTEDLCSTGFSQTLKPFINVVWKWKDVYWCQLGWFYQLGIDCVMKGPEYRSLMKQWVNGYSIACQSLFDRWHTDACSSIGLSC